MQSTTRRHFLAKTGGSAAGLTLSALTHRRAHGANERVQVALLGCGGRGRYDMRGIAIASADIVQLCDLNNERLDEAAQFLSEVQDRKPKFVKDMRRLFDSNEVDAVIVATPDHWHSPASILACQAEKDVYVEKPHSHNVWESGKLVEAARKYKRIVQVGTQNRSGEYNFAAREYVKTGKLGGVPLLKVYNLKPGGPFHLGEPGDPPAEFDWDAWLGPAKKRSWHQNIYKRGWHKFWEYSGGDMANDGIHQLDLAMMLMGNPGLPSRVSCTGGRLFHKDDGEVPDVQVVTYDYDDFVMTFELSGYPKYMRKTTGTIRRNDEFPYWTQNATRIELYGAEQMMTVGRHGGGWQITSSGGRVIEQMYGRKCDDEHYINFLECVKSRKRPTADIGIAHQSCSLIHFANIAHRVGNVSIEIDKKRMRFVNNDEANAMLKREYRNGYRVPEKV